MARYCVASGFFFTGLLGIIPAAFYAIAFYQARDRIVRRELRPPLMGAV